MMLQIAQRIGIPLVLLLLGGAYFMEVRTGNPQDSMLIRPVFYLMTLLFLINAATDLRAIMRDRSTAEKEKEEKGALRRILLFCAASVGMVVALPYLGFVLSAMGFLFVVLKMFKVESDTVLYLMPIGMSIALYLLFDQVFSVPLPQGFLGF